MDSPIVARDRFILWVTTAIGALASGVTWSIYGPMVGGPVVLVAAVLLWRALRAGFVLDGQGLTMRSFMPGSDRKLSWHELKGVSVDEVVVGTNDGRATKLRVRFIVDGGGIPQLIGCPAGVAQAVIARFEARGLPASDDRG